MEKKTKKMNLAMAAAVLFAIILIFIFSRSIMIEGSYEKGKNIVYNYSLEEERNLEIYKTLIAVSVEYVQSYAENGESQKDMIYHVKRYLERLNEMTGGKLLNPYAVINGEAISPTEEFPEEYDYRKREWYKEAIAKKGEIIFTDLYEDSTLKKEVLTVAMADESGKSVVAFDIFSENFRIHDNSQKLPKNTKYFVYDKTGKMLYWEGNQAFDRAVMEDNFSSLYQDIKADKYKEGHGYFYDSHGKKMVVYSEKVSNGWLAVFAVPYSTLTQQWYRVVIAYIAIINFVVVLLAIMWVKWNKENKDMRRVNEIVRMMGNVYYAFYQVDMEEETYEVIKGGDLADGKLKKTGSYPELLAFLKEVIYEEDYKDFAESFSMENIKKQLKEETVNFGGDFRRYFDGELKWVNVIMLTSPKQEKQKVILSFRIVEAEKQQQLMHLELLQNAMEEMVASEKSQKQFFFNMSHDMRTPLNVIIGMSDLAKKHTDDPEKVRDYLKKINYSSRQLLSLINDILEISRLDQRNTMKQEVFNLEQCIKDIVGPFEVQAEIEEKQMEFECRLEHKMVLGDKRPVEQILNNLLSNAMKFTTKGDRVFIRASAVDKKTSGIYQITVADTGLGMSPEFMKRLFQPYEREKRFASQAVEGTGLGMPIVKSIVSLMGGEITVESELEKGSRFTVTLPFDYTKEEVQPEASKAEKFELAGKTILLAEDYELNMEVAAEILEIQGARVIPAWNGREAVEKFEASEEFSIDVILMDMQMPEMDGCEAASRIRKLPREDAGQVPIVALTANVFSEDIARTAEAGMDAHISKPIDIKVLSGVLSEIIKGNTNRIQEEEK